MCDPTGGWLIAATAASVAATGANFVSQSQNAQAQGRYQGKRYSENAVIALDNYAHTIGASSDRVIQEAQASAQEAEANQVSGAQATGQVVTSAAAGGVGGNSIQELLQDYAHQASANDAIIESNLRNRVRQIGEDLKGAEAQTRSNIASATPQPIQMPSLLATGLTIAGQVAGGVAGMKMANLYMGGTVAGSGAARNGGMVINGMNYGGGGIRYA